MGRVNQRESLMWYTPISHSVSHCYLLPHWIKNTDEHWHWMQIGAAESASMDGIPERKLAVNFEATKSQLQRQLHK